MNYSCERKAAHERLPGTHANVGIRNLRRCVADLYFHVLCIIKDRPHNNFGELWTVFIDLA